MYCLQYTKSDELLTPPVIKLAAEDVKKFLPDGVKNFLPTHVKNSLPRHVKNSLPCGCKITLPRTGKWMWWSRGIGGRSALDYLIKVRGYDFVQAVQTIAEQAAIQPPVSVV